MTRLILHRKICGNSKWKLTVTLPVIIFLILRLESCTGEKCKRRICIYRNTAQYRPTEDTSFFPADIDPKLCTHIVYEMATLSSVFLYSTDPNDETADGATGNYELVTNLKKTNTNLKVLISFKVDRKTRLDFLSMISASRFDFIDSSWRFIQKFKFDGLEVNFVYDPNDPLESSDKTNFVTLLSEMKAELGWRGYLITVRIPGIKDAMDNVYNIGAMVPHLNWIHLMLNDATEPFLGMTGHPHRIDPADNPGTVSWLINYAKSKNIPNDKIVVSIPFISKAYTLLPGETARIGAEAALGWHGLYTQKPGYLAYFETCLYMKDNGTQHLASGTQPYIIYKTQFVALENNQTVTDKVLKIIQNNLGGFIADSMDLDDFKGIFCGSSSIKYPLLLALNRACT